MASPKLLIITLFCCFLLVSSDDTSKNAAEYSHSNSQILSILDYLNANSNGVYEYKSAFLLSSQYKADIVEVTAEVNVECLKTYPELPCNVHALTCHAFIRQNPDQSYQVLSDVKCSPKIEIRVEDVYEPKSAPPMVYEEQNQREMEKIDLSSEAVSSAQSGADFVAIRRDNIPCLGCPFDLNTHAEGVDELVNTAIKHIESERSQRHKIINIKRLQQQVVAGLKYILLADVAQTTCPKDADLSAPCILDTSVDPFVCEITFIEKPWISRSKHIIKNNCTVSQEFEPVGLSKRDQDDMNNEILPHGDFNNPIPQKEPKPVPNYDAMAQTGNMEDEMDAARLADLESQILFGDLFESPKVSKVENTKNVMPFTVTQPEYISVEEPSMVTTDIDNLKVEPLNAEENIPLIRIPLYSSVPVIDESEPVVTMYNYHNEEPVKPSGANIVNKNIESPETTTFDGHIEIRERLRRELKGDSDSDSDSDSSDSESKEKGKTRKNIEANDVNTGVDIVKREVANTSEDSSKSDDTSEEKQKVRREAKNSSEDSSESDNSTEEKDNKVKRETADTSEESDESSGSDNTKEKKRNRRKVANTSEDSSKSDDTSEEKRRVRREAENSSGDSSESDNSTEEKGNKVKRETADTSEESGESPESDNTKEKKGNRIKSLGLQVRKRNVAKREAANTSENSSRSDESESNEEKKNLVKREATTLRGNNDDDSSSSSSSDDDDNKNEKYKQSRRDNEIDNNNNNDDSSSSSSDDDDNKDKKRAKQTEKDNDNDTSSSSSDDDDNNGKRHKRSIGQMEKISSDEKIIVRDLADFAAATLDNIDEDHHKRVILQILGAKKLKLDGVYYQIILRLGISHCHENEHNENCREKLFTNLTKICKVQVHVDDDYSNPKVVKSQCQNIKKDENDRNRTNYSRYKRSVLVGGHTPMSTDNSSIKKFVKATLEHLDSTSKQPNKHKAVEIISATSQIVAGVRYIVTAKIGLSSCQKSENKLPETCGLLQDTQPEICTIDAWDRPWLNKTSYRINCNDKIYNFGDEENKRRKRGLAGGISRIPKDSEDVLNHLNRTLLYLDSKSEHENKYIVDEVLSASQQVVAGSLLRITARLALSDCKKGSESNCTKLNGTLSLSPICKIKVWEKPWLNFTQTNVTCDNNQSHSFRTKREVEERYEPQLLGADEELSLEHAEAKNFINMALKYFSSKSEHPGKYELKSIEKVTRRIVAGTLWNIEAKIALCKQIDLLRSTYSMCPNENEYLSCKFKVINQSWQEDDVRVDMTCDNDDQVYSYVHVKGFDDKKFPSFNYEGAFKRFITKYNKVYGDNEYGYRFKVFRDNVNKIALLNKYEKGSGVYGFTPFADMTEKEFSQRHGYRSDLQNENELPFTHAEIPDINLPKEFDWRAKAAVTEVKDQGMCGSCWAFSVTGNVEGQYAIKHGKLLEFSEQELVDCDKVDQGCDGGLMDNAYRVIEKLGGLETESDYPYEGEDERCIFNLNKVKVELTGALNISHNETDMAKWLVQNGPISIAINANAMQFYVGGVSHPWKTLCNPKNLDHGVLIVGYGVDKYSLFNKTLPYWIVKNSWGKSWGEQGYYRVYRGDGTCGLNQTPSSAIVA